MTEDGHRIRCTNCGKFSAIPMHPVSVFSGDRVFIGTCTGCGALQGYSPKSWSPSKNAAALREVRGRAVRSILTALRDGGAPAGVFKAAMSSARYCLDDPDGYTVKEFAARVNDLIDAAVDDEAVQREALVDRNVKAMLDDVEAALNVRGSKPWRIEARDGKFCVLLEADGSVEKCFPTRQEAEQHMRALYANATEGEKRHEPPAHLEALEALEGVDSKAEKHRLL